MNGYSLLEKMELIDLNYIEAAEIIPKKKTALWLTTTVAACLCIILGILFAFSHPQKNSVIQSFEGTAPSKNTVETHPNEFTLSSKTTAKVSYGCDPDVAISSENNLVYFSESEMFEMEDMYILRGKVLDLTNITLDFNGEKMGRCIATIEIQKVFKGNLTVGEQIAMLIPCPIGDFGVWHEDSETITHIKTGMEGVFMPWIYDEESSINMNGAVVMLADLAECGLADGLRWTFLSSDQGILFTEHFYPSAKNMTNLEDVETYITEMLK